MGLEELLHINIARGSKQVKYKKYFTFNCYTHIILECKNDTFLNFTVKKFLLIYCTDKSIKLNCWKYFNLPSINRELMWNSIHMDALCIEPMFQRFKAVLLYRKQKLLKMGSIGSSYTQPIIQGIQEFLLYTNRGAKLA